MSSVERWSDKTAVNEVFNEIKGSSNIWVTSTEVKEVVESAPLLYDLTALQQDANVKYGYSAEATLSIAQRLYEFKLITYPRTGSRYITEDVFEEIPKLLRFLKNNDINADYVERKWRTQRQ